MEDVTGATSVDGNLRMSLVQSVHYCPNGYQRQWGPNFWTNGSEHHFSSVSPDRAEKCQPLEQIKLRRECEQFGFGSWFSLFHHDVRELYSDADPDLACENIASTDIFFPHLPSS